MPETGETMAEAGETIGEMGETSAPAPEVLDARLRRGEKESTHFESRIDQSRKSHQPFDTSRTITRRGKPISSFVYKQTYETLVLKHEEYTSLIEDDETFTVEEHWLEECQETFMNMQTNAKLYIESKAVEVTNVEQSSINGEACTSVTNLEEKMDGETSMQKSNGIPVMLNMHETALSNATNTPPAAQAPQPVNAVTHSQVNHANEQPEQSMNQTCSFKMEKPKMPKFSGDVREYAIFRADFKYAIESRYSKRDAMTFLRTCLEGKPLELLKGIGSDYDAAWEYLDSVYGDPRYVSDTIAQDIGKFRSLREGEDSRFCELVHLVRRCYKTLKEVGLSSDMDNSHMLSIIEQKMCVDDRKVWSRELQRDGKPASLKGLIDWMSIEMKSRMRATAPIRIEQAVILAQSIICRKLMIEKMTVRDISAGSEKVLATGPINVKKLLVLSLTIAWMLPKKIMYALVV